MGKAAVLLMIAALASPVLAARQVSVAQLEQGLAAGQGKRDGKGAKQLSGLKLTERASSTRLSRWEEDFRGRRTRDALVSLADESSFLNLPAEEAPALARPAIDAQRAMLSRTVDYLTRTVSKPPDFSATRQTTYFRDLTLYQIAAEFDADLRFPSGAANEAEKTDPWPLRVAGTSSVPVTYREGKEVSTGGEQTKSPKGIATSFTTSGEFGPILNVVLGDTLGIGVRWSHWEQGAAGPLAVFSYAVPHERSHYDVSLPYGLGSDHLYPAYHGEIAIDPVHGDVMRLTVMADFREPYRMVKANILVEYAPVDIGGTIYTCPVKGVAVFKAPVPGIYSDSELSHAPLLTQLHDVAFTHYHLFRAEMRIFTGAADSPAP